MNDGSKTWRCCICKGYFKGWGNNPYPVVNKPDALCCDECNFTRVIPARLEQMCKRKEK